MPERGSLEHAIELACTVHRGQLDKADLPYIYHPIGVARRVAMKGGSEIVQIAAVLHDVVEDGDLTIETVRVMFGGAVAYLVEAVTHGDEDYDVAIDRVISAGGHAILLKSCDIDDNLDKERLAMLSPKQARKSVNKYTGPRARLSAALDKLKERSYGVQ